MTDATERAELVKIAADLDSFVHDMREDGNDASALWLEQRASALRRLAAQDQKPDQEPVAWQWRYVGETNWKTPLGGRYPPKQPEHLRQIEARPLFAAPQPAAAETNASAEARLREALRICRDAIQSSIDLNGVDCAGAVLSALSIADRALSAHSPASDCDKQGSDCGATRCRDLGCFGVCKPSDRPADVTVDELHAFILKHSDEWEDEGVAARAILDAFTVGRR